MDCCVHRNKRSQSKFWRHVKHVSHFSEFLRPHASQIKKLESFGTGAPALIILKQVHLQSTVFSCFQCMVQRKTCDMHSWFLATAHLRTSTYFSCMRDAHATAICFTSILKLVPSFNMQASTSPATCKAQLQTPKQYPKLKTLSTHPPTCWPIAVTLRNRTEKIREVVVLHCDAPAGKSQLKAKKFELQTLMLALAMGYCHGVALIQNSSPGLKD